MAQSTAGDGTRAQTAEAATAAGPPTVGVEAPVVGATIAEVALPVAVDRVTATTQVTHATAVIEAEASESK